MKTDIRNKEDIEVVVRHFYQKVKTDAVISTFFSDTMVPDWDKHINKMCTFWENILFYTGEYKGDPLATHRNIHRQQTTNKTHFDAWLQLFNLSVDDYFSGPNAEKMKHHANGIASVMQLKI